MRRCTPLAVNIETPHLAQYWKNIVSVGFRGAERPGDVQAVIDLEGCGPSQPRNAMRAFSAAGSEIRPYRSLSRIANLHPSIFHGEIRVESLELLW